MSSTETLQEAPALQFTDAAARKVGDLIKGEGNPKLMLRVFVQGGGCSGLQYGFEFDEQIQDGDTCVENLGVKLLVDPMSVQYLTGAEIDYREGLEGAQFVIRNPQAATTCGCGSSFSRGLIHKDHAPGSHRALHRYPLHIPPRAACRA